MTAKGKTSGKSKRVCEATTAYGVSGGEIVLYQTEDGSVELDVRLEKETIWLSLNQLANLFERDKSVVSRHLNNIFRNSELDRRATVAFFETVQNEGGREVTRQIEYYNLDAIISVGYRVNSKRGTQFRIWATQVLRDHILKGYTLNKQRLEELNQIVRLAARTVRYHALEGNEASALLQVVSEYSFALEVLDDYDHARIKVPQASVTKESPIALNEARIIIAELRAHFNAGTLFGKERDNTLESSLAAIFQSVGGRDAYPGIENKAVQLLYFLIKNHPFVDGNKRIAAAMFLWFLKKNRALYQCDERRRIVDETLVAITVLMAESAPSERYTVIRLALCLLHGNTDER